MTIRTISQLVLIGTIGLCFLFTNGSAFAKPPNIVLILADDLGFSDTQPYGSEIPTPNISKLANEGLMFTNYHTAANCSPTRAMLLTGVDCHRNGVPNIPEAIPPKLKKHTHYQGTLNHEVVTIATQLRDAGYHTYMTGKWHLGMTPDLLPSQRGFERTVTMADTGADNFEKKTYSPLNKKANWFADGKEIGDLPEDFYSSKFYVDKTIEFIESNRQDGLPFFSYIAFQAVHTPVQAPQAYTDKYMGTYDDGWQRLREKRLERAVAKHIVPPETRMVKMPTSLDWDSLNHAEKKYESKKMAVYAGMVDAMDHHMGRLLTYLKETGQYDHTIFIFTSDNGPASTDVDSNPVAWERLYLKLWMKANGINRDYETLGTRGSYINMGITFASSAASPLAYYKFWVGEGGMRVPLIISGKNIPEKGKMTNAFTYVTDITPTILDIAGVKPHQGSYQGRRVEPMIGKSLLPLVNGNVERVYHEDETVGYELTGHAVLFKGDYKIVKNRGPVGDDAWHLFNIVADPGETTDLKEEMPERFADMMAAYRSYVSDNNVLPVPKDYEYFNALRAYSTKTQLKAYLPIYLGLAIVIIGSPVFLIIRRSMRRQHLKKKKGEVRMKKDIPGIGRTAPDFEVAASDGSTFKLSHELKSGKNIKLVFYRGHW